MRGFKIFYILMMVSSLVAFGSAPAQAASNGRCYAPNPQIQFAATLSKVKFNTSESAFNLNAAHGGVSAGLVTGLANDSLFYEFKGLYRVQDMGDGTACVSLDKIKVYYRARPIVFISKEFPRGSCEFNAVVAHENKHVKALKNFHKKSASDFRMDVESAVERARPIGPITKFQVKGAQKEIEDQISMLLSRSLTKVRDKLSKEQNRIDSPSEYERVNAQCEHWAELLRLD